MQVSGVPDSRVTRLTPSVTTMLLIYIVYRLFGLLLLATHAASRLTPYAGLIDKTKLASITLLTPG
jgi:hypothetical protein